MKLGERGTGHTLGSVPTCKATASFVFNGCGVLQEGSTNKTANQGIWNLWGNEQQLPKTCHGGSDLEANLTVPVVQRLYILTPCKSCC